jgi:hypothetical protein
VFQQRIFEEKMPWNFTDRCQNRGVFYTLFFKRFYQFIAQSALLIIVFEHAILAQKSHFFRLNKVSEIL